MEKESRFKKEISEFYQVTPKSRKGSINMNYKDNNFTPGKLCDEIRHKYGLDVGIEEQEGIVDYSTIDDTPIPEEIFKYIKTAYKGCKCVLVKDHVVVYVENHLREREAAAARFIAALQMKKDREEGAEWYALGYETAANKACDIFNKAIDAMGEVFGDKTCDIKEQFKKCLFEDPIKINE